MRPVRVAAFLTLRRAAEPTATPRLWRRRSLRPRPDHGGAHVGIRPETSPSLRKGVARRIRVGLTEQVGLLSSPANFYWIGGGGQRGRGDLPGAEAGSASRNRLWSHTVAGKRALTTDQVRSLANSFRLPADFILRETAAA
jgi:hypothetical protein